MNETARTMRISEVRRNWRETNNNKREGKVMRIGKYHVDYDDKQYLVYSKTAIDKRTGKESPRDTSYFHTLAGALSNVRHQMIGTKIGKAKEEDLSAVMAQILNVDKYFADCLTELTESQAKLVNNIAKKENVGV